ncbi:hypothetical protein O0I10_005028 [Lichtheimia ornata]|uniref:Uncharacterized protein n=1 Tax=Lichtheimia ornata TaxID=688661 RepID=A0AAD7V4P3_9FUNG|nr:uncharacterized protein O0I10_005028 [Lichtheimia ornata]KAJ8659313.1 hypothetical protein O0I10_005028 [Lichtheimia ornata]
MPTSLYALPFAESKSTVDHDTDAGVNVWVNDLDDFPPLSLKPASAPCSNSPSSSSTTTTTCSNKDKGLRIHREWEVVKGIEFSSHTEDDWEDIDYSTTVPQGSFASMAAKACVDHDQAIPMDKFLVWPKRRQRHVVQQERSVDDDVDDDDACDDLATFMYEAHKSQSRKACRRIPYMQQRRRQLFDVIIRRHVQTLSQEQAQYKTRREKDERDIAAIEKMRQRANEQHHALTFNSLPTPQTNKMALYRSLLIYELRHRGLIPPDVKSPIRHKPQRTTSNTKRKNKQELDDDQVLQKLIDNGQMPHYDYDHIDNQRILGILASGIHLQVNGNKKINTKNSREVLDYVISHFAEQDYCFRYYNRDTYYIYRRILLNLFEDDRKKFVEAEKQLNTAMASDNSAPLRAMFRTLSRDCFTPRDRNMRKQLIAHHFDQYKQMSQNLSQQQ